MKIWPEFVRMVCRGMLKLQFFDQKNLHFQLISKDLTLLPLSIIIRLRYTTEVSNRLSDHVHIIRLKVN